VSAADPLRWIAEAFSADPTYFTKSMFGCKAIYLGSRLVLATSARSEPWNGLLCPTEREYHPELQALVPALQPHSVLGKWLYLSRSVDQFEQYAMRITERILDGDQRWGVEGDSRGRSKKRAAVKLPQRW
jgi:hypothetical protein